MPWDLLDDPTAVTRIPDPKFPKTRVKTVLICARYDAQGKLTADRDNFEVNESEATNAVLGRMLADHLRELNKVEASLAEAVTVATLKAAIIPPPPPDPSVVAEKKRLEGVASDIRRFIGLKKAISVGGKISEQDAEFDALSKKVDTYLAPASKDRAYALSVFASIGSVG